MALLDSRMLTETLIAFLMIGMLGFVLRWTFSHSRDTERMLWPQGDPDDFGLLAPVAVVDTLEEALQVRATLSAADVKATTTIGADGRHRVLVFANQLDRARHVGDWSI